MINYIVAELRVRKYIVFEYSYIIEFTTHSLLYRLEGN